MRIFKIMTITIIAMTIVFAGCKGGGAATKPTQVVKPTPTTKPTVKKPSTDLSILANHFATKKYDGDTKQYTIDDIKAPQKIVSALTNTKISYIKLLRNEILARRGYVFKSEKLHGLKLEVIKEILQPAKWYSSIPDFIYADLTKIEIANVSFLKRLEKIEAKRGNFARQLALVVGKDKHDINTDEAVMIFKITKDADVLTSLNPTADKLFKELIKYKGWNAGNGVYELQMDILRHDYLLREDMFVYGKFILSLKEGDRIYLKGHDFDTKRPVHYVAEVYMNFPITKEGKGKSVPNWDVSFNYNTYLPESYIGHYNKIYPFKDGKFCMGSSKKIKEINIKIKTVKDIILSSDFQKTITKYVIEHRRKGFQDIPYDLCLYEESKLNVFNFVKFNDSGFYFLSAYRPDVRHIFTEGHFEPISKDLDIRPYKAEWTSDKTLFKGVRLYRYIKVN